MIYPRIFFWVTLLWLLSHGSLIFAQQRDRTHVSGDFKGLSFLEFAQQVESQSSYRFFFIPAEVDSVTVTVKVASQPLEQVLQSIFKNTPFRFFIDAHQQVYVLKGEIQAALPIDFFRQSGLWVGEEPQQGPVSAIQFRDGADNRLYEIGIKNTLNENGTATLSGIVVDGRTKQPVIGAVVMIEKPLTAVATDQKGAFSLVLPVGRHELKIKSIGMREVRRQIMLYNDGQLTIPIQEEMTSLSEVLVTGNKDQNVRAVAMGIEKLDMKTIKLVPTAMGEADVLKVVLTLPGVKSVGESSTGLNVRGGATDQNLILFNDAIIYNPSHLFGFFSAFNPDVVKGVELYKSSIPAKYGGRLASVLKVTGREGNGEKISAAGGLGMIASRLMVEGPIIKDKTSFLIGGRASYSDWLLKLLPSETLQQSKASFYDVNATITHQFDSTGSMSVSGYRSHDQFRFGVDTTYKYQNEFVILSYKKQLSAQLQAEASGAFSHYSYGVTSARNPATAFDLEYDQQQSTARVDFQYTGKEKHTLEFGATTQFHQIRPGTFRPVGSESLVNAQKVEQEQALESALYLGDTYDISNRFSISVGLRYALYQYLGKKEVIQYAAGTSRSITSMVDTLTYGAGQTIKTYHGPEYRVTARFSLTDTWSVKAAYNRNRQFLHMLTNSAMMSPTDIWKLSDSYLKPQVGDQWSAGLFKNFKSNAIETSVEVYYKTMQHMLDYKSGANLLLNPHIETDVINSRGKAYGVEVMLRKNVGKLNGWVSYTYSRTFTQSADESFTEKINKGNYYPSNADKPHDFIFVGNYKVNRRFSTSLNLTYSTGRPITLPMALYEVGGAKRIYYSERNQFRIPDYYRADIALNIEGGHKIKKLAHSSWTIAVYNLTGRRNPYSVYFKAEEGVIKGYQLSVFGQPIPTVTYNFKF